MARKKLSALEQINQLEKEELALTAKREGLISKRYLEIGKIVHKAGLFDIDNKKLAEILAAGKELALDDVNTEVEKNKASAENDNQLTHA
ncbi:MAG: DUF6437 family protein [Proteobacteria bacterium]|nr:DUF6437 family protein [Pseudomonadota bacterium]